MICANFAAVRLNLLTGHEQKRIENLILKMPVKLPENKSIPVPGDLLALMYQDKKVKEGHIQLILADKIGRVRSHRVTGENLITESFEYLFSLGPVTSAR